MIRPTCRYHPHSRMVLVPAAPQPEVMGQGASSSGSAGGPRAGGSGGDGPMKGKKYIFRWKDCGIEVWPTRSETEQECWERAEEICRPASMTQGQGRKFVKAHGEVVVEGT